MLSSNSILQQGRYRITRNFWDSPSHSLYDAHDTLFGQDVIIYEGPDPRSRIPSVFDRDADDRRFAARFNRLISLSHPALVGAREFFNHSDRKCIVSEATDGWSICQMVGKDFFPLSDESVARGVEGIFDAFSRIAAADRTVRCFHANPANIRIARGGEFKFLYFGIDAAQKDLGSANSDPTRPVFAFMPLEDIWTGLDLASQKAIAKSYDQRSLDLLESAPDFRSDIYMLGSICYFLLTGKLPVDALERSIELLDGKPDPLIPPHRLNRAISPELSGFVMKAVDLKREDRFDNFDTINHQLTAFETELTAGPKPIFDILDEDQLLEIPSVVLSSNNIRRASVPSRDSEPAPVQTPAFAAATVPAAMPKMRDEVKYQQPTGSAIEWPAPERGDPSTNFDRETAEFVSANPLKAPNPAKSDLTADADAFAPALRTRHWVSSPVAVVTMVVALFGIVGWLAFTTYFSGTDKTIDRFDVRSTNAGESESKTDPFIAPANPQITDEAATSTDETPLRTDTPKEQPNPTVSTMIKGRQVAVETKSKPATKPAVSENTPKPKKKVTVDDLISDN